MEKIIILILIVFILVCLYKLSVTSNREITIKLVKDEPVKPAGDMIDMSEVLKGGVDKEDQVYDEMGNAIKDINETVKNIFGGSDRV